MAVCPAALAELVDVVPELELVELLGLLELLELQAAISVAAAKAASAAVVAREGPGGPRPGYVCGISWEPPGGFLRVRGARRCGCGRGTRSAVCQENRSDVCVMSMGCNRAQGG